MTIGLAVFVLKTRAGVFVTVRTVGITLDWTTLLVGLVIVVSGGGTLCVVVVGMTVLEVVRTVVDVVIVVVSVE